ncbi:MAG TPA: glycosyltransferase family 2 protein [Steroidobacteraceae bacterium]|nr:glycosyltransferase family 2 protein [Steroidobacteraceae bacterium]
MELGLVVIGRNEGERLMRCLASVREIPRKVYVDSGSTDGSVERAGAQGVTVVELPVPPNFTAARARNSGLAMLLTQNPELEFVQMVDGDCEIRAGWVEEGLAVLRADPKVATVFGRLRERFPDLSVYNALCDDEWNIPIGDATGSGGVALFRVSALRQVDFYNEAMIAGEDSELSMRLRKRGWRLRRIDVEMAVHDAALTRFSQWWTRTRRSGHGFGEMAFLHPDARSPNWPRSVRSIVFWGGAMPIVLAIACVLGVLFGGSWWALAALVLLVWPARMTQLAIRQWRRGLSIKVACASGVLLMLGKIPQLIGLAGFHRDRLTGRASSLIEHKRPQRA